MFLWAMLPEIKDATDIVTGLLLQSRPHKVEPKFRNSTTRKNGYTSLHVGNAGDGRLRLLLWFNDLALRYFPQVGLDAATAVHYYESDSRAFAILIWHSTW